MIDPTSFAAGAGIALGLVVALGSVVVRFNRTARRNVVEALRPVESSAARIKEAEDEYASALCRVKANGDYIEVVHAMLNVPVPAEVTATRAAALLAEVADLRSPKRLAFAKAPAKAVPFASTILVDRYA